MSEPKKPVMVNPAKQFLQQYLGAKLLRRELLLSSEEAKSLHYEQLRSYEHTMKTVMAMIDRIEHPKQRAVLIMRYINGMTWEQIIIRMADQGYSESLCYQLHGRALLTINRIMDQEGAKHDKNETV